MGKNKSKNKTKQVKSNKKAIIIGSIIAGAVIVLATVLIIIFATQKDRGDSWETVTPDTEYYEINAEFAERYLLNYDTTKTERKEISDTFGEALIRAWDIFIGEYVDGSTKGLQYLNSHEGEIVEIDPVLYTALELFMNNGDRTPFMGPLFEYYDRIFGAEKGTDISKLDPLKNKTAERLCETLAQHAADNNSIELQLLGENNVIYTVSDEYYDLLLHAGLDCYIGFGWMTDAFIVDYLAGEFIAEEYTHGSISSYSGFARNLDTTNTDYTFGVYDKYRETVYLAASASYKGSMTTVTYKSFAASKQDHHYIYHYPNGDGIHGYLNINDGKPLAACDTMIFHSKELSCAEVAIMTYKQYICDVENEESITELLDSGIGAIWFDGSVIYSTSDNISLHHLFSSKNVKYTTVK